jgi:alpha-tubulin suppressor-like RCC1 family protein
MCKVQKIKVVLALLFVGLCSQGAVGLSPGVVEVSAGMSQTLLLFDNGTVWKGDANGPWHLFGTEENQIVNIDAGFDNSIGVDSDGNVWMLGGNTEYRDGDYTYTIMETPTMIKNLSHIVQVSAGSTHCAVLDENGHVWTWGTNRYGELGTGDTRPIEQWPVQVPIDDVKMVDAGGFYTVALKTDGTVWAWGDNYYGQIGDVQPRNVMSPVLVKGLSNITKIDAGYDHTLALDENGVVWAWGDGAEGKIGPIKGCEFGHHVTVSIPYRIEGLNDVVDISAGDHNSMALDRNGDIYIWGVNDGGQFGNGNEVLAQRETPGKIPGMKDAVSVSMGFGHCIILTKDGSVWAWGRNYEEQIGKGLKNKVLSPLKIIDGGMTTCEPGTAPGSSAPGMGFDTMLLAATTMIGAHMIISKCNRKN